MRIILNYKKKIINLFSIVIIVLSIGNVAFADNNRIIEVVTPERDYVSVAPFINGVSTVRLSDNIIKQIDINGNEVYDLLIPYNKPLDVQEYQHIQPFSEGLAAVMKDGKFGYINMSGEVVIPFIYEDAQPFVHGLAPVGKKIKQSSSDVPSTWTIIDNLGNESDTIECDYIYPLSNGLFRVYANMKYGYIDINGNERISLDYDVASEFNNGLALVGKDGKSGYINTNGDIIVPFEFDYGTTEFSNGYAWINKNGKYGIIKDTEYLTIKIDDKKIEFDTPYTWYSMPIIQYGKTYLPVDVYTEEMGLDIISNGENMLLVYEDKKLEINDKMLVNDVFYLPARDICEYFFNNITWNGDEYMVSVSIK